MSNYTNSYLRRKVRKKNACKSAISNKILHYRFIDASVGITSKDITVENFKHSFPIIHINNEQYDSTQGKILRNLTKI